MIPSLLKKSKVAKNAFWIIAGKVFQSLLSLIIGLLTARYLGPFNYGIINYAASLVTFVVPLMNLGLTNVIVNEQTQHPDETGKIYGSAVLLSLLSSVCCVLGLALYTFLVDFNQGTTNLVVILYSLMLVFQAVDLIQYWFQTKLISKYVSIVSFVAYSIVSVYKILLLIYKCNIFWFAISNCIDYLIVVILLIYLYYKLGGQKLLFSKATAKRMLHQSKYYIVAGLMVTLYSQTDKIMIKLMLDESSVGYYSAAVACAGMSQFVFGAIIDSMRPAILQHKKENNVKSYENYLSFLYGLIIYLALAQCIIMTCFSSFIIPLLYGNDYLEAIPALQIVVWYTTFAYVGTVRNIWVLGEQKQKYLLIINFFGAVLNILMNLVLIYYMGIIGAAIASLITEIFVNIIVNFMIRPLSHSNLILLKGLNIIKTIKTLKE